MSELDHDQRGADGTKVSGCRSRSVPPRLRGSCGRDPSGASRRQPLDGAFRHAARGSGAQAPCSLHVVRLGVAPNAS